MRSNIARTPSGESVPEARAMPGATCMGGSIAALRLDEELRDRREVLVAEVLERGHHVVPERRRVRDVALEVVDALPGCADVRELRRTDVRGPGTQVDVALQAADLGEDLCAAGGLRREATLLRRPAVDCGDRLAAQRLARCRALVGENAHRDGCEH